MHAICSQDIVVDTFSLCRENVCEQTERILGFDLRGYGMHGTVPYRTPPRLYCYLLLSYVLCSSRCVLFVLVMLVKSADPKVYL